MEKSAPIAAAVLQIDHQLETPVPEYTVPEYTVPEYAVPEYAAPKYVGVGIEEKKKREIDGISLVSSSSSVAVSGIVVEQEEAQDGGYGWLIVLASFIVNFACFGFAYIWGIYQDYFYRVYFNKQVSQASLSFISSLQIGILLGVGLLLTEPIARWGVRVIIAIGAVLCLTALLLSSFIVSVWQLYLTLGLMFGLGSGFTFTPSFNLISQYFNKRRGLALGLATSGSGVGGLALGPLTRYTLDQVGFRWSLRIHTLLFAVLLSVVVFLAREPSSSFINRTTAATTTAATTKDVEKSGSQISAIVTSERKKWFFQRWLTLIKNPGIRRLAGVALVVPFGYFGPFVFLPAYSVHVGLTSNQAALLTGLLSAFNAVGRIGYGFISDVSGKLPTFFFVILQTGLSALLVWPFAKSFGVILFFAIYYGIHAGAYIALFPTVACLYINTKDPLEIQETLGFLFAVTVFGNIFGTGIMGFWVDLDPTYLTAILWVGGINFLGSLFALSLLFVKKKK